MASKLDVDLQLHEQASTNGAGLKVGSKTVLQYDGQLGQYVCSTLEGAPLGCVPQHMSQLLPKGGAAQVEGTIRSIKRQGVESDSIASIQIRVVRQGPSSGAGWCLDSRMSALCAAHAPAPALLHGGVRTRPPSQGLALMQQPWPKSSPQAAMLPSVIRYCCMHGYDVVGAGH